MKATLFIFLLGLFSIAATAGAQTPPDQQKIEQLRNLLRDPAIQSWLDASATQRDVPPASVATSGLPLWEQNTRSHIRGIVAAIPAIPGELSATFSRVRQDNQTSGDRPIFVPFALLLAAGFLVEWMFRRIRGTGDGILNRLAPIAVFACAMTVAFFAVEWSPMTRVILLAYLLALFAYRVLSESLELATLNAGQKIRCRIIVAITLFAVATAAVAPSLLIGSKISQAMSYIFSLIILALAIEAVWSTFARSAFVKLLITVSLVAIWLLWCIGLKALFWLGLYALFLPPLVRGVGHAAEAEVAGGKSGPRNIMMIRGARALIIAMAAGWLAIVWQFNSQSLGHQNPVVTAIFYGALKSVVVLLIADLIWQLAKDWIDRTIGSSSEGGTLSAEEATRRGRLRTLLPIFRNALAVTVVVVTGLTILSEFGVQIAPLIAGAGIFGIALGFGAQTLVKDVISGVFYMLDDAFRVGEYIQSKNYKGTVEGFSLRSVRLRHHRGPVFTVPFGELGAVENMSRDWSIVKFTISVGYDTDVAKVKAITKAIGKDLASDEEFAPVILENLKMKGLEKFGEYGIDLSFGMMLRPSSLQSMIRRRANLMLREAFNANGISFATPSVTVGGDERSGAAAAVTASKLQQTKIAGEATG